MAAGARRLGYALVALPLGLAGTVAAPAARLRDRLAHRWLGPRPGRQPILAAPVSITTTSAARTPGPAAANAPGERGPRPEPGPPPVLAASAVVATGDAARTTGAAEAHRTTHRVGIGVVLGEVVAFALTAPAVAVMAVRGVAYPLVTDDASTSWGGPTMAGAWAVHAAVGVVLLAVVSMVVRPLLRRAG